MIVEVGLVSLSLNGLFEPICCNVKTSMSILLITENYYAIELHVWKRINSYHFNSIAWSRSSHFWHRTSWACVDWKRYPWHFTIKLFDLLKWVNNYTSPLIHRDQQLILILSFELNYFFFCADMFPYEDSKTVSVCLYPGKKNRHNFVNISPTLVINSYINLKVFTSTTAWKHKNLIVSKWFLSKKVKIEFWHVFWLVPKCWNYPSFVNVSPTLVIGTWFERFSRVIKQGIQKKNWLSSQKKSLP